MRKVFSVFFPLKPSVCVVGYYFEKKRALATGYAIVTYIYSWK